jgi:hypothetical protein
LNKKLLLGSLCHGRISEKQVERNFCRLSSLLVVMKDNDVRDLLVDFDAMNNDENNNCK